MSTVRDLIKGSLRLIGAIATGETPSADEQADGLSALNSMVNSWSTQSLLVFERVREEFPLVPGTQSYTMGVGGTFDTSRPMRLESAGIKITDTTTFELPLDIINLDQWAMIVVKDTQSTIPTRLYAETSYPLLTLNLWPVPSLAHELVTYSWKPISAFASANSTVSFPPGYEEALKYNLAVRLAPEYGKAPDAVVVTIADESKANIKRMNIKAVYLGCDAGVLQRQSTYNILTGDYR